MGRNKVKEKGQILLITVMLLATALTIALSISYTVQTETKISKMKEKEKQALDAAEAGAKTLIGSEENSILINNMGSEFQNFEGEAKEANIQTKEFVTPLIEKDGAYTFYLANYDQNTNTFSSPYFSGHLTFYFGSEAGANDCSQHPVSVPAIELTLIYGSTNVKTKRWVIDPCMNIDNAISPTHATENFPQHSDLFSPTTFYYNYDLNLSSFSNPKLLIIHSLFEATKVGISGTQNLPKQGKMIISTATTKQGNVTKRIRAFQSYPQIPSDFFITRLQ